MKKIYLLLIVAGILSSCGGVRRLERKEPIRIVPAKLDLAEKDYEVEVDYSLTVPRRYVPHNAQVVFTPVFTYLDHKLPLTRIVLNGKNYERMERRKKRLYGIYPDYSDAVKLVATKKQMRIDRKDVVPFKSWMPSSKLMAYTVASCCGNKERLISEDLMAEGVYYMPPSLGPVRTKIVKEEMIRKEEGTAVLHFPINSDFIDPAIFGNEKQIREMKDFVAKMMRDTTITIVNIIVTGVASPDGPYDFNAKLAQQRAQMAKNYLITQLGIKGELIKTKYVAEDWDGLRKLVNESTMPGKERVLSIIDSPVSDAKKDSRLYAVPQFRYLADNLLPQLRKVIYEVFYVKKEQKEIIVPE